jgi:hypothetical protein
LRDWSGAVVVYRAVRKHTGSQRSRRLSEVDLERVLTVLVGAASRHQEVQTRLPDPHRRHAASHSHRAGGVVIAERHAASGAGHTPMLRKQDAGCECFVSQVCYDLDHTSNLLSDYTHSWALSDNLLARANGPV